VRLCVQLDRLGRCGTPAGADGAVGPDPGSGQEVPAGFGGGRSMEALEQAIIGKAVSS
jgi:hypothetical protein